ncbi:MULTISPECIES: hypothetical protein [Bacillus]|uniref:YdbL n=1 Tax=Bacillus glycinifermentans TaxID=1664069 RepID=A0A0T6BW73_9BACI|nr:hypothetical protein [Bacillus glycinifermentans]ATH94432.1 hypothetical protein COP00_18975 [Bacillus glycinifermentans]KRT95858.1 hypothetical protein AB447_201850 [Bacillus glycinifermentans]MBU8788059.1 hypothetical protein [Bacillus glycinifermentans]MEC0484226.1 hypothetical protein [Bacillus glycinifermentans]MEC3607289.1 hypothetical protein [Bacillus glycinifermentans]
MRKFITALPIILLLSFSFVTFAFHFDHLVYFRLALGLFSLAGLLMLYKLKNGVRFFIGYLYASWIALAGIAAYEEPLFSDFFFGGLVITMGYLTYMLIYLGMKTDGRGGQTA